MKIDKVLEEFENKEFSKVYFLIGEEEAFKNEFLQSLKKKTVYPEFNWENYYAEELDFSILSHSLFSLPFLSQLKVIVIKNAGDLPAKIVAQLSENASRIPSTNCLILSDCNKPSAQIEQFIATVGKSVSFDKLTKYQLKDWIINRLKEDNKKIDSDAIVLLIENTNGSLAVIAQELDKLTSYIGEKNNIEIEDIKRVGIDTKTYTIYQLVDKISEKKMGDSLNILRNLLISEMSPQQIIGMMRVQFSRLWEVKALISNGLSSYQALGKTNIPFFKRNFFLTQIKNFTYEGLKECFNLLLDADIQIKRGAQANLCLELLLFRLTR